jgi:hypothetical protein
MRATTFVARGMRVRRCRNLKRENANGARANREYRRKRRRAHGAIHRGITRASSNFTEQADQKSPWVVWQPEG